MIGTGFVAKGTDERTTTLPMHGTEEDSRWTVSKPIITMWPPLREMKIMGVYVAIWLWIPETEQIALSLVIPESWKDGIKNRENLRSLTEIRLRQLILESEDPEEAVKYLDQELDVAGLIGPYHSRAQLAKGDKNAIFQLLQEPELWQRLLDLMGELTFPILPNATEEQMQDYEEVNLLEWTNDVTSGL